MATRRPRRRKGWSFPLIRDVVLFIAGLAGLAYETIFTKTDRPTLLLLYAAMLGLPAFLQANQDRSIDEREIAEALRRRLRPSDDDDDEDELAEIDERRRKDLMAELKEIEDRQKPRRRPEDDSSVHRLPHPPRLRRDPDDDDHDGTHGKGRR